MKYDIKKIDMIYWYGKYRVTQHFVKVKWLTFFVSEDLQCEGGELILISYLTHLDNAENSFHPTCSQWFSWIAASRVTEPYEINSAYVSPVVSMAYPL